MRLPGKHVLTLVGGAVVAVLLLAWFVVASRSMAPETRVVAEDPVDGVASGPTSRAWQPRTAAGTADESSHGAFRGRLVSSLGRAPLADAHAVLREEGQEDTPLAVAADGNFAGALQRGSGFILASATGHAPAQQFVARSRDRAVQDLPDLVLTPGVVGGGRVVLPDGVTGVADAEVWFTANPLESRLIQVGRTARDGRFSLRHALPVDPRPRHSILVALAPAGIGWLQPAIAADGPPLDLTLRLRSCGAFEVQVVDPAGTPVPDAELSVSMPAIALGEAGLRNDPRLRFLFQPAVDGNGRARLPQVPAPVAGEPDWRMPVPVPDDAVVFPLLRATAIGYGSSEVELRPLASATQQVRVVLERSRPFELRIAVRSRVTGDGIFAEVQLRSGRDMWRDATAADGRLVMPLPSTPGTAFTLDANATGYITRTFELVLPAIGHSMDIELPLDPSISIAGIVMDPELRPVAGIDVLLSRPGGSETGSCTTTEDGAFHLWASGAGTWLVSIRGPGETLELPEPVRVVGGDTEVRVVLRRRDAARGSLRIEAFDARGQPLAIEKAFLEFHDLQAQLYGATTTRTALPSGNRVVFEQLVPGTWRAFVVVAGIGGIPREVQIRSGEHRLRLDLPGLGRLRGVLRFEGPGAEAIPAGVQLTLLPAGKAAELDGPVWVDGFFPGMEGQWHLRIAAGRSFTIRNVLAGERLTLWAQGLDGSKWFGQTELIVRAGGEDQTTVVLRQTTGVHVRSRGPVPAGVVRFATSPPELNRAPQYHPGGLLDVWMQGYQGRQRLQVEVVPDQPGERTRTGAVDVLVTPGMAPVVVDLR